MNRKRRRRPRSYRGYEWRRAQVVNAKFDWTKWPLHPSVRISPTCRYPKRAVRRIVLWCLVRTGAWGLVDTIRISGCIRPGAGWHLRGLVVVRLGSRALFPLAQQYPARPTAPRYVMADWMEALAGFAAHEFHHAVQWATGKRPNEVKAEHAAVRCVRLFRRYRAALGLGAPPKSTPAALARGWKIRMTKARRAAEAAEERREEKIWRRATKRRPGVP